ncbi:MAG: Hsp70 family protein [Planctomycetaceae bacterium]|nr:MAG: Hsp70 family protein [Planctomycetaceae bacterium]
MASQNAIGIDLGTTFSAFAYLDRNGMPQTIANLEGDLVTPSAVFFDYGEAVVGREAIKAASYEPEAVAMFAKRDVGKPLYHRPIRGQHLPPEVILAAVLRKLKDDAAIKLDQVEEGVITVPAFFNEPKRKAVMDAGRLAGLKVLDIINEPTAAAIAYGVQAGFVTKDGLVREPETILVYDLGGGTFDVTLMKIEGSAYTALATDGDSQLGGIDWDQRIVQFLAEAFLEKHRIDPREDAAAHQALMREAEEAKRGLSTRSNLTVRFAHQGRRIQVALSREEFESLTADLVQRTIFTADKLLRDARSSWAEITRILLVGGSTRMPMIAAELEQQSGMSVDRSISPDEAVAHGAALYAGFLQRGGRAADRNLAVKNVNSHDLGVLGLEKETGMKRRRTMIPRNTTLPARSRSRFVTHRVNQQRVVIHVVEGGDDSGKNATPIGKCIVSDLPPRLPAKTPVIVQFFYAANGRLSVKAALPDVGVEASTTIEKAYGLSEEELVEWESRIAQGKYLLEVERPKRGVDETEAWFAAPPAADAEPNQDFDGPHVFQENEDSEIFSDLEF